MKQMLEGETALDIARKEHREEIIEILQTWSPNEQQRTEVSSLPPHLTLCKFDFSKFSHKQ